MHTTTHDDAQLHFNNPTKVQLGNFPATRLAMLNIKYMCVSTLFLPVHGDPASNSPLPLYDSFLHVDALGGAGVTAVVTLGAVDVPLHATMATVRRIQRLAPWFLLFKSERHGDEKYVFFALK